jgi:hypothetical protein
VPSKRGLKEILHIFRPILKSDEVAEMEKGIKPMFAENQPNSAETKISRRKYILRMLNLLFEENRRHVGQLIAADINQLIIM